MNYEIDPRCSLRSSPRRMENYVPADDSEETFITEHDWGTPASAVARPALLSSEPRSAFVAIGSAVKVRSGVRL